MAAVWDECLILYSQGTKYQKVMQFWQTQSYKFYGEVVRFPSRTLLWQEAKHAGETQCPACEDYVPKEETEEIFIKEYPPRWVRICKVCYLKYRIELQKQKGPEPNIGDYFSIKRNPKYVTSSNPRGERNED
jgi:hypothetical protein